MNLETIIAETLRDHVKSGVAQGYGMPSESVMQYRAMHEEGDDLARPCLVVEVEREQQTHPELAILTCRFTLTVRVARDGAKDSVAGETASSTAHGWLSALRAHLDSDTRLKSAFNAISLPNRNGWQFLFHYLHAFYPAEIDKSSHELQLEQVLTLNVRVIPPL